MKPYYSIEELAHILHDSIHIVADGLIACGVVPIYNGKAADLSQWANLGPFRTGKDEIFIIAGQYPDPAPTRVIVAFEVLPQLWKDHISAEELLTPTINVVQPVFDKASPAYPEELDFALQAWCAVSATEEKGKPKMRISAWLNKVNATLSKEKKLSNQAIERIAIVANWDKRGGATRSD